MKCRFCIGLIITALTMSVGVGCSSSEKPTHNISTDTPLQSESDSLAYIIGMNVARELQKTDSLINYEVVCRAIMEHSQGNLLMSDDEARIQYLRYLLHVEPERQRSIEERFLADLVAEDRSFTRTKSGLAYNIGVIGDEKLQPKSATDWVTINYHITRVNGDLLYPTQERTSQPTTEIGREELAIALSDLPNGVQEALKLIGKGGQIKVWIPSKWGYGEEGNSELGIEPMETTFYDIQLIEVERNAADKYKLKSF